MTVIQKLSDRDGLILSAIKLIVVNEGNLNVPQLQYRLFQYGIFAELPLLKQAVSVLIEKKIIKIAGKDVAEKPSEEKQTETTVQ